MSATSTSPRVPERLACHLERALSERPVVVLQAPIGYGKRALAQAARDDVEVLVLDLLDLVDHVDLMSSAALEQLMSHVRAAIAGDGPRVLLSTRMPLPAPLLPLQAQGFLEVVGPDVLALTVDEAASLLRSTGASASDEEAATLYERTRGWPAAYRFVSGQPPRPREALDAYLEIEAFESEPPDVRDGLLRLSIYDVLPPSPVVSRLRDHGLLLEERKGALHFHPLYADFLRRRAIAELGDEGLQCLHDVARDDCEARGRIGDAVDHALAGTDPGSAVSVLWGNHHGLMASERWAELARLVKRLPAEALTDTPEGLMLRAWAGAPPTDLPSLLARAEQLLKARDPGPGTDERMGELAVLFAHDVVNPPGGPTEASRVELLERTTQALRLVPGDRPQLRGDAWMLAALAAQMSAEAAPALTILADARRELEPAGGAALRTLLATECFVRWKSGDLAVVEQVASRMLRVDGGADMTRTATVARAMLGRVHYQRGDLVRAESLLDALGPEALVDSIAILLFAIEAQGRTAEVDQRLAALRRSAARSSNPCRLAGCRALEAELAFRRGDVATADTWAEGFTPSGLETMHAAFEPILTQARIFVACPGNRARTTAALAAAQRAAALVGNRLAEAELLALEALHAASGGDDATARAALERSFEIGRRAGAVRLYVDQGPAFLGMVGQFAPEDVDPFVSRILESASPRSVAIGDEAYRSPLSLRELDVLEHLAKRERNKDIAKALDISVGTVKKHTTNLFRKLEASSRKEAVERALRLGILR